MNFLFILGTILFTVYGQLILKWRITSYGALPFNFMDKVFFLLKLFLDPFIISGFLAAFVASLFWMAAMTKFDLSFAYPFMSLSFVLVMIVSGLLFKEPITFHKITGLGLIIIGLIVTSKSL